MKDYKEIEFCDHCKKDTIHDVRDAEHERDSSQDRSICSVCGWWRDAYEEEHKPPIFSKKQK